MGFMFCYLHVSLNNPSSGDINSSNLPCFSCFFCRLQTFFKINFVKKILPRITSECQTAWIQIKPGCSVWPDLGPNCLERSTADDKGSC